MTATAIKERPILFSSEMVRAILDGRKTQTRRIVKQRGGWPVVAVHEHREPFTDSPPGDVFYSLDCDNKSGRIFVEQNVRCPHGAPGDQLWVRESLVKGSAGLVSWKACPWSGPRRDGEFVDWPWSRDTLTSIHMPRWASRLTLEVESVRVERVQDISEADAKAEGVRPENAAINGMDGAYQNAFVDAWVAINGEEGWQSNPWVWAITFRVLKGASL